MANINLPTFAQAKEREFRSKGAAMARFAEDVLVAVNEVIGDINTGMDRTSTISFVDNLEGSVGIDEKFRRPFSELVTQRLIEIGQRPPKGLEAYYNRLAQRHDEIISTFWMDSVNLAQYADQDSDDTTDTVGLGALG